jgi:hypothetical protein
VTSRPALPTVDFFVPREDCRRSRSRSVWFLFPNHDRQGVACPRALRGPSLTVGVRIESCPGLRAKPALGIRGFCHAPGPPRCSRSPTWTPARWCPSPLHTGTGIAREVGWYDSEPRTTSADATIPAARGSPGRRAAGAASKVEPRGGAADAPARRGGVPVGLPSLVA